MKFVKSLVKRTKSFNAAEGKNPGLRRTSSFGAKIQMQMPALKRNSSFGMGRKDAAPVRRTKSLDPEEMKAGLDDSVEFFAMETPTIASQEELQDIIDALALSKSGESSGDDGPLDEATLKKQIAKVKEFWRLVNAKKPEAAYQVISDDIQAIQKHWDVISTHIQKPAPSRLSLERVATLGASGPSRASARVA